MCYQTDRQTLVATEKEQVPTTRGAHQSSHLSLEGVRSMERYRNGFLEDEVLPKVNCFENCFLLHLNEAKRLALNGTQFPEQICECVCLWFEQRKHNYWRGNNATKWTKDIMKEKSSVELVIKILVRFSFA